MGHKQPANLTEEERSKIREIIVQIAHCMRFENCPSHTELKINERGIFVIETSPRLGGDYITSTLTSLSTGINMEDQLLHIALGEKVDIFSGRIDYASGICFFSYPRGEVDTIAPEITEVDSWPHIHKFKLKLKAGDSIHPITSSLNRYGQFIVDGRTRREVDELIERYELEISRFVCFK